MYWLKITLGREVDIINSARLSELEAMMEEQAARIKKIEEAVQNKIDSDAAYQTAVLQAFSDLKSKIPDTSAIDAELSALEAELTNLKPLEMPA